jgi:hypothetical protein
MLEDVGFVIVTEATRELHTKKKDAIRNQKGNFMSGKL